MSDDRQNKEKLLQHMQEAVRQDKTLREQYQMGDKFRFIRDRLAALLQQVETSVNESIEEEEKKDQVATEEETLVYVYLYNAQGLVVKTWQKMLSQTVFYEYSINRPIYAEKTAIEAYIRSKPNKVQHGYLTIIVRKNDVVVSAESSSVKDTVGNALIKVREGSLAFPKMISFTHNGNEYVIEEGGELVKKDV